MTRILALVSAVAMAAGLLQTARPPRPKLIVQIVIDQMRGEYVERYGSQWTKGLRRLLTEGAYFPNARYPYAVTVTCAGHSSIGTGTTPSEHGMVLNEWWDRDAKRRVSCPGDSTVTPVGLNGTASGRYSGRPMLRETFAERLDKSQPAEDGRVATFSLKPRSAIGLAGHSGDAVIWFDAAGTFATSSAFGRPEWLVTWLAAHPIDALTEASWTRLSPEPAYRGTDQDAAARPTPGWTSEFPHKLSDTGKADTAFYDRWQRSPYSDAYLTDMVIAAIDTMSLGQRRGTDYLGVSFSALDLVGHKFGPASHEVQDVLMRADDNIGRLLAHLDARVGRGNYVVALTADHGVGEVPEDSGGAGGRLARGLVAKIIQATLDQAWGAGTPHVEHDYYSDFYLTADTKARLEREPATLAALITAIEAQPGVQTVATWQDMAGTRDSSDPVWRALRLSYHPQRSGDLMLLMREHFTTSIDAASHGTYYDYDRRVPVILFGSTFKAGRFEDPASPLDIPATWARLTGVALDRPFGRSLDAAIH